MKKYSFLISVIMSLLPLSLLSIIYLDQISTLSDERINEIVNREVEITSKNLRDFLSERNANVEDWLNSSQLKIAFEFQRPEGLSKYLETLKNKYHAYEWIIVLDGENKIFAETDSFDNPTVGTGELLIKGNDKAITDLLKNNNLYVIGQAVVESLRNAKIKIIAKIKDETFTSFAQQMEDRLKTLKQLNFKVNYQAKGQGAQGKEILNTSQESQLCKSILDGSDILMCVSVSRISFSFLNIKNWIFLVVLPLGLIFLSFLILNKSFRVLVNPYYEILESLDGVTQGQYNKIKFISKLKELSLIERKYNDLVEKLKLEAENAKLKARAETLYQLSKQVSHDIRSPLTALNMMMSQLASIPEESRIIIRSAVNRINDIANHLLQKSKEDNKINQQSSRPSQAEPAVEDKKSVKVLLAPLIEMIISEKRIQVREKQNIEIESDISNGYGLFASMESLELKRIISNLLNNSVEAFLSERGKIKVSLQHLGEFAVILVEDNGRGIPEHVLSQLGNEGVTFGKEGTQSGTGLGLFHTIKKIKEFGGEVKIESTVGSGTKIYLLIPKAEPPSWFVEKLTLHPSGVVVTVDDDITIHQIWKERLDFGLLSKYNITHRSFTSALEFGQWINSLPEQEDNEAQLSKMIFLIDYEFLNQNTNGLELIERLRLTPNAILVTSRYEEELLLNRCQSLKVKVIPKPMATMIPIEVVKH